MSIAEKLAIITGNEHKVYAAGQQTGRKAFMQEYQNSQYQGICSFAGACWGSHNFYPVEDIIVGNNCFNRHNIGHTPYDLAERLKECGVKLVFDTISANAGQSSFYYANISRLPDLDMSNLVGQQLYATFEGCQELVTIDKINFGNRTDAYQMNYIFEYCSKLQNIVVEGIIAHNFRIVHAPLTYDSAMSIINALKDYSGTSKTYTVTFKATTKSYLNASDIAIATQKGWTVA